MPEQLTIDKTRSALLVMDYENDIVKNFGGNDAGLLNRAARTVAAARAAGVPVIYVVARFRPGYPEISPNNRVLARIRAAGLMIEGTPGAEIHTEVAPQEGEVVVVKRRAGAFSTSDLVTILKAKGVNCLILMGIATSGVVLSTVRWAADADYEQIVVEDCCADPSAEVHQLLTSKVFPSQASVVSSGDLIEALQA